MKRRNFLQLAALAGALTALARSAFAWPAEAFRAEEPKNALAQLFNDSAPVESDAIRFKAPEIAENGAVVPVTVEYNGAAKTIAILVEENPQPLAAAFQISPKALAHVSTRIKMGKSSRVSALVQTADGKLLSASREVKVTIGGCGG